MIRIATLAFALLLATPAVADDAFTLKSADFEAGGKIAAEQVFNGFGCKGANVSPALAWSNAPEGTKSFAVLVHDPDAPTGGSGWWHWLAFNIPADATGLAKGAGKQGGMPKGSVQSVTDYGKNGWGGPCPPPGPAHRYNFTVYALKVPALDLKPSTNPAVVGYHVNANAIGKATLMGKFGRAK